MTTRHHRLAAAAAAVALILAPVAAHAAPVDYIVDGDTIRLTDGRYVRLIGINTPEQGQCGHRAAKTALDRMISDTVDLPNPAGVDDADRYGRLLRYVEVDGRDTGLTLIRRGLAVARYDGTDGYDEHPRQARYHRADAASPNVCS